MTVRDKIARFRQVTILAHTAMTSRISRHRLNLVAASFVVMQTGFFAACSGPENKALPDSADDEARSTARACDRGDSLNCNNLAAMYEAGDAGLPVSLERAATLYAWACDNGAFFACFNAGRLLADIRPDEAVELLEIACSANEWNACHLLGRVLWDRDEQAAVGAYITACQHHIGEACYELAEYSPHGDVSLYQLACAAGSTPGCAELAGYYLDPLLDSFAPGAGIELMRDGCMGGNGAMCVDLARRYREGDQVAVDISMSEAFTERACAIDRSLCV